MEEINGAQNSNKTILPTKTKIATIWLMVLSILFFALIAVFFLLIVYENSKPSLGINDFAGLEWIFFTVTSLILAVPGILLFLSAKFIFKAKKWAWLLGLISTLILFFVLVGVGLESIREILNPKPYTGPIPIYFPIICFAISFIFLVPAILLLLARKNFWKATKLREQTKNIAQDNKIIFPVKTEIAAWLIMIASIFFLISVPLFSLTVSFNSLILIGGFIALFFLSAISILKSQKLAWFLGLIISFVAATYALVSCVNYLNNYIQYIQEINKITYYVKFSFNSAHLLYLLIPAFLFIPPILLLLDRKNFWKIAR
ncbi:MAG: hypothetical protein PHF44_01605 [Candidatus Pacebacteria bacterium]|nr:hypothetical protein [Candidatus Paceibacterota bacterium]